MRIVDGPSYPSACWGPSVIPHLPTTFISTYYQTSTVMAENQLSTTTISEGSAINSPQTRAQAPKISNLQTELQSVTAERDDYRRKLEEVQQELAELTEASSNAFTINKLQQEKNHLRKTLKKATDMLKEKVTALNVQEKKNSAMVQQVSSLKEVLQVTRDLLNIRNMEVEQLQQNVDSMEGRIEENRKRQSAMIKQIELATNINGQLRNEYETQLKLFQSLKLKYEEKVEKLTKMAYDRNSEEEKEKTEETVVEVETVKETNEVEPINETSEVTESGTSEMTEAANSIHTCCVAEAVETRDLINPPSSEVDTNVPSQEIKEIKEVTNPLLGEQEIAVVSKVEGAQGAKSKTEEIKEVTNQSLGEEQTPVVSKMEGANIPPNSQTEDIKEVTNQSLGKQHTAVVSKMEGAEVAKSLTKEIKEVTNQLLGEQQTAVISKMEDAEISPMPQTSTESNEAKVI